LLVEGLEFPMTTAAPGLQLTPAQPLR
jgi:hypothetical protein